MRNQLSYTRAGAARCRHRHRPRRHRCSTTATSSSGDGGDGLHLAPRATPDPAHGQRAARPGRRRRGLPGQPAAQHPARSRRWRCTPTPGSPTSLPRRTRPAQSAGTVNTNLGGSAIWLLRPTFNLMFELLWLSIEDVVGPGQAEPLRAGPAESRGPLGLQLRQRAADRARRRLHGRPGRCRRPGWPVPLPQLRASVPPLAFAPRPRSSSSAAPRTPCAFMGRQAVRLLDPMLVVNGS